MEYLQVGKRIIEYELRKSSKAKKMSISVKNCKVTVVVPTGFTFQYARNFAENNKDWILKQLEKQTSLKNSFMCRKYVSGERFLYRGRKYPLKIIQTADANYQVVFKGSRIIVYIPEKLSAKEQTNMVRELVNKWYRGQAEKLLPEQVEYYSKLMNIPYNKLKIKEQKTRWGSCSSKGNINLNWRIIMAPNQVMAYVIIHELAHVKYMNHCQEFWKTVSDFLPDYKKWKKWLAENGRYLME